MLPFENVNNISTHGDGAKWIALVIYSRDDEGQRLAAAVGIPQQQ